MMAIPALAQAPVTNGGNQRLSDQFVGPVSLKIDITATFPLIVAQSYLFPTYVRTEPPSASVTPRVLLQDTHVARSEWQEYLASLTTKEEYEVLNCIATKESGWVQKWNYLYKTNPQKYTAYGFFQILESTARGTDPTLDRFDPYQNIELAVKLYRKSGATPWLVWPQCIWFIHFLFYNYQEYGII